MEKEFKVVPGHRQYEVSRCGTVVRRIEGGRSVGRPLKFTHQKVKGKQSGYLYVAIFTKNFIALTGEMVDYPINSPVAVHRLVALTFIGMPPVGKPWVNHKDGNKGNNSADNLEWMSISENIKHSYSDLGRDTFAGERSWNFGKEASKETRKKMSKEKIGKLHPKYKGFYIIYGKKFYSAIDAGRQLKMVPNTIIRRCRNPKFIEFSFVPDPERKY